jgi:dUTP pyrophosphatase
MSRARDYGVADMVIPIPKPPLIPKGQGGSTETSGISSCVISNNSNFGISNNVAQSNLKRPQPKLRTGTVLDRLQDTLVGDNMTAHIVTGSTMNLTLKIKKLAKDAKLPERANASDSGADIFAHSIKRIYTKITTMKEDCIKDNHPRLRFPLELKPGERALIGSGIAGTVGLGFEIQVRSRSGLALKQGLMVTNGIGTIDESYTGEIGVILSNTSETVKVIKAEDKIAQLVVASVVLAPVIEVKELEETARGEGGFGSTDSDVRQGEPFST